MALGMRGSVDEFDGSHGPCSDSYGNIGRPEGGTTNAAVSRCGVDDD